LAANPALCRVVETQLRANWSPEQIAGWLVLEYPEDSTAHVSYETIDRTLFIQARGALTRELTAHLRTRRPLRRSQRATNTGQTRGQIVDAVSIAARPACSEDRDIPGHWEGDLLAGAKHTHIATLVERTSRDVQMVRVTGKDTKTIVTALTRKTLGYRTPAAIFAEGVAPTG
jgi:IS30 family transposase